MSSPEALFAAALKADPGRPLVTFYDDATGERVELSAKSMANWVAKTHFLLTGELALGPGEGAFVALPAHWLAAPILFGCWSAGLSVVTDPNAAAVAFVTPQTAPPAQAGGIADVYAIAPQSAARGFAGSPPDGLEDYVLAVRPQPDSWSTVQFAAGDSDPAIDSTTRDQVVAAAADRARELGLPPGARVLAVRPWTKPADWVDALLAALTVGGSVVLVANEDESTRERRTDQERVTALIA